MAGYEKRDMSGSLFRNDKKDARNPDHDKYADYTGSALVNGEEFWLNAWLKTAKNGTKYMSLSLKPKEQRGTAPLARGGGGDRGGRGDDRDNFQGGGGRQQGGPQRTNWERDVDDQVPF